MISWLLKAPFEGHERQERMVMDSGLDWASENTWLGHAVQTGG